MEFFKPGQIDHDSSENTFTEAPDQSDLGPNGPEVVLDVRARKIEAELSGENGNKRPLVEAVESAVITLNVSPQLVDWAEKLLGSEVASDMICRIIDQMVEPSVTKP